MIKRFVKDTGIYGISNVISKGISIFLVPFYTRVLTPNDYGIIDIIAVISAIVAVTVPFEISQAVARFLADANTKENRIIVSSTALIFTIVAFLLFIPFAWLFSLPLAELLLENKSNAIIIQVASLSMFFTGLYYFVQNQLKWLLRPIKFSILAIVYTIVSITLTIYFVLILKLGVIGVFWANIISALISFFLGIYYARDCFKFIFSFTKLKEMLTFSYPLVPSSVGVFFLNYAQRIIIKGLMTLTDLGLFGVASRLSSFINIAFQSIQGALVPLIYQHYKDKDTPESLRKMFNYLNFILLLSFLSVSLFSREVLWMLTTPAYYSSSILVPFLFTNEIYEGLKNFASGLVIKKKTKKIAIINVISAIVTVLLSFIMIYLWGLIGAAIAISIKSISIFIIQMFYSQKEYFVPFNFKKNAYGYVLAVLFIALGIYSEIFYYSFIIKIIFIIIYFFTIIYLLKIIEMSEIISFLCKLRNKYAWKHNK